MKATHKEEFKIILMATALFLGTFFIYLSFLTKLYWFDSIYSAWMIEIEAFPEFFHPNHLFYTFLGNLYHKYWKFLGFRGDALRSLQMMNAFLGSAVVGIFFIWLRKLNIKNNGAVPGALLLAFSYAYWYRSSGGQVYIVSSLFLLLTLISAYHAFSKRTLANFFSLGLFNALAILFHIANVLFLPVVILLSFQGPVPPGKKLRCLSIYFLALFLICGLPYLWVMTGVYHFATPRAAFNWFLGAASSYSNRGYTSPYWSFQFKNLLTIPATLVKTIWYENIGLYIKSSLLHRTLSLLSLFSKLIMGFFFSYLLFAWRRLWRRDALLIKISLIGVASYTGFFIFWEPGNIDYWITRLIPLYVLISLSFSDFSRRVLKGNILKEITVVILTISLLLVTNFLGAIYPQSKEEKNLDLQKAFFIKDATRPGDGIIICGEQGDSSGEGYNIGEVYIPYFSRRECLALTSHFHSLGKEKTFKILQQYIAEKLKKGKDVYLLSEVLDSAESFYEIVEYHKVKPHEVRSFFISHYEIDTRAIYSQDFKLYHLIPKGDF